MKVALIQSELFWEDQQKNREQFSEKINSIKDQVDLVVLPEMFTTGFSMNPKAFAENMDGETILWMQNIAKNKNTAITGSLIISENGNFYNRLLFVFPSGEIKHYDKRHLFSLAGEEKVYTAGTEKLIVEYKNWKVCLLVCYDLRFPAFSRNTENYDLMIYVANWPEQRITAWDSLLKARAIENVSFVIGVNRFGNDGNDYFHNGHSQMIDPLGNYLVEPMENEITVLAELNRSDLREIREKFPFLNDRDRFTLKD